jgi:hypothetical protein
MTDAELLRQVADRKAFFAVVAVVVPFVFGG